MNQFVVPQQILKDTHTVVVPPGQGRRVGGRQKVRQEGGREETEHSRLVFTGQSHTQTGGH